MNFFSLRDVVVGMIPKNKSHRVEFYHLFLQQVYFTFVQGLPLLGILGMVMGLALAFQAKASLGLFGKHDRIGQFLVYVLFRELSLLSSILIIIARSVTAVTAEIATMKVQNEILALRVLGVNIIEYIFAPRVLGGMVSLFSMAFAFCIFSFFGSWLGVNIDGHMSMGQLFESISLVVLPGDIIFFCIKANLIGFMIFYIGCSKGLSLSRGAFEVPIVTNQATVRALFVAFSLQGILSSFFYLIYGVSL